MAIIGQDTPWSRLFEMTYAPQYRLITVEFISAFVYKPHGPDFQPQSEYTLSPHLDFSNYPNTQKLTYKHG
ncbi:hypothetical protein R6Q57_016484 [Mikania cordata]